MNPMLFRGVVRVIHFVGIGGIGMSGIAEVLLTLGFSVTGSDVKESATVSRLRGLGATIHIGHAAEHVGAVDVLVRSTAVGASNIEVATALERGIPVIRRAEMLAELMRLKHGIAVGGSHGKTTTTSMVAQILGAGGFDPTVVIGGRLDSLGGSNARLGQGDFLVAEADESDGTFTMLSPTVSLISNIDPEHLDHYGTTEALEEAFLTFANQVPFYGFSVLCLDHPVVQRLVPKVRRRVVSYGLSRQASVRGSHLEPKGVNTRFRVHQDGVELGEVELGMPGEHNVVNALGAAAVALTLGIPFEKVQEALHGFGGVQRRFTVRGEVRGVLVVDDYGHHPVEIEATLRAAEQGFPERRLIAIFQPHRYTRVQDLWSEFCGAFQHADIVLVCPVYAAGEAPIPGIDHETLANQMRERGHKGAEAVADLDAARARLVELAQPGDLMITLGAGDITRLPEPLLEDLA